MRNLLCVFVALLLIGCKGNQLSPDEGLIVIDVSKKYPEKEILLSNIADISYVQLDETDDDYLHSGYILCSTDNTIVVFDSSDGDILFFTKNGRPKSKFNRKGNGPAEYTNLRIGTVCYNEKTDEFYALVNKKIEVYSSRGEHKRSLPIPDNAQITEILPFGENTILLFDDMIQLNLAVNKLYESSGNQDEDIKSTELLREPFIIISSADGSVQDSISLPHDHLIGLSKRVSINGVTAALSGRLNHVLSGLDGNALLLHHADTDTLYRYTTNGILEPVMVQTPTIGNTNPITYISSFIQTSSYQFIEVGVVELGNNYRIVSPIFLTRDRRDGSVSTQKIVLDDFPKKEDINIAPQFLLRTQLNMGEQFISMTVDELHEANSRGGLSGELKAFVDRMPEDNENDVLMLLKFK